MFGYLEDRFGLSPRCFSGYHWFVRKESWWLLRKSRHLQEAGRLKVSRAGMKAVSRVGAFLKPTTRFIQVFGGKALRAKVVLEEGDLGRLLAGERLPMVLDLEPGYVILEAPTGPILGLGLYLRETLQSQLPRKEFQPNPGGAGPIFAPPSRA